MCRGRPAAGGAADAGLEAPAVAATSATSATASRTRTADMASLPRRRRCGGGFQTIGLRSSRRAAVVIGGDEWFTRRVAGSRRRQVAIDLILATVSGALFVLTLTVPDWIEAVFGIDPDGGNGALEFLLAATFLA